MLQYFYVISDFIRANKEKLLRLQKIKTVKLILIPFLKLDDQRRELIQKIQILREERNKTSHGKPDEKTIARGKKIKEELKSLKKLFPSYQSN